jgi:superfamily II DNA or RNA helicase
MIDSFKDKWQEEAIEAFKKNKSGIVKATMGAGKTVFACKLMKMFKEKGFTCVVVVDGIAMKKQWEEQCKDLADVFVVNSIALKETIHQYDFTVFDEIDKYLGEKWFTVFDKIEYKWMLGLTGTLFKDAKYKKLLNRFKIIYEVPIDVAIENNIVSDVKVYNLHLPVSEEELQTLKRLTREGQVNLHFFESYQEAIQCIKNRDLRTLIANQHSMTEKEILGKAMNVQSKYAKRKEFIQNHPSKINTCIQLIERFKDSKIMTFSTLNQTADIIANLTNSCVLHSDLKSETVKKVLEQFKNNEIRVINSVKKLISGIDVPDTDTAIVVNYTSSKRDLEQMVGRVIRKFKDKQYGRVIFICFGIDKNSQDFVWLKSAQANLLERIGAKIKTVYNINEIE